MSKMFIIYDLKADFEKAKSTIDSQAIVFIKDSRQIYTHGIFFSDQATVDSILSSVYSKSESDGKFATKTSVTDLQGQITAVKSTADAAAPKNTVYTKAETDAKIATATGSVYRVKGTVANAAALTALTGVAIGDTYNVTAAGTMDGVAFEAGSNFVATKAGAGNQAGMWDKLGGTIDLSGYVQNATLGNYVPKTTKVNAKALNGNITLNGADIALTGYTEASAYSAPGASDTVNAAIAKVNKGVQEAKNAASSAATTAGNYTVNAKKISTNPVLSGADIKLTGYATPSGGKVSATDTTNNAIKKLDEALAMLGWEEVPAGA